MKKDRKYFIPVLSKYTLFHSHLTLNCFLPCFHRNYGCSFFLCSNSALGIYLYHLGGAGFVGDFFFACYWFLNRFQGIFLIFL